MAAQAQQTFHMDDHKVIEELYEEMYRAMIAKDTVALGRILDDEFILVHMTGMRQSKQDYLRAIANGTLNYFACDDTNLDIQVNENDACVIGQSKVVAAVFGGGKHQWPLQLEITLKKENGNWLMTKAVASTY